MEIIFLGILTGVLFSIFISLGGFDNFKELFES